MTDQRQLRTGSGRRPRLSDGETEERMLAAGARFVEEHGFSLSLEHLSMEDLIHAAGVSRTSSYRKWPTKDAYAADLLVSLAQATQVPVDIAGLPEALAGLAADPPGVPSTAAGRHELFVELLRVVLDADFRAAVADPGWRTFTMLRVSHMGLPAGDVRDAVAAALRLTEDAFTRTRAQTMRAIADVFGMRLRRAEEQAWEPLSLTLGAYNTGMLVRAYADPTIVEQSVELAPFGVRRRAPWPPHALAAATLIMDALQPDPDIVWDKPRVVALSGLLADPASAMEAFVTNVRTAVAASEGS